MYEIKLTLDNGEELEGKFDTFEDMADFVMKHEVKIQTMEVGSDESSNNHRPALWS
jgi:hypothetical protein